MRKVKISYGEKKILRYLLNKRGQMPKTLQHKFDKDNISVNLFRPLNALVEKKLVIRRQVPVQSTSRSVSHATKTKYFITEKGLYQL